MFFVSLILSFQIYATEQIPDRLLWNGKTYLIGSYQYPFEKFGQIKKVKERNPRVSTALWRRYVAEFEIVNGKLVCKRLFDGKQPDGGGDFCGDIIGDGIFCDWFSGKNIKLIEMRPSYSAFFLEEKSYVLNVKNGMAEVVLAREMPEIRMSHEDKVRRGKTPYDPKSDNLQSWFELGYLMFRPKNFEYDGWPDIDICKSILQSRKVKTRGILQYCKKLKDGTWSAVLYLPATRTSPKAYLVIGCPFDCSKFLKRAVEAEIENPLRVSAAIASLRELKKSESIHNAGGKRIAPDDYKARGEFADNLKKLYAKIQKGSIDESKLSVKFSVNMGNISLIVKYPEIGTPLYSEYLFLNGIRQNCFDIEMFYPDTTLKCASFELRISFNFHNTPTPDFDSLENWKMPKIVSLGGIELWRFENEKNKVLKFITSPLQDLKKIAEDMTDTEALNALQVLSFMRANADETGRERIVEISRRIKDVDFRKHPDFAHLLSWAVDFNCGRDTAKIYAAKLAEFIGHESEFNGAFIDSCDFENAATRREVARKVYSRILNKLANKKR